MKKTLILLILFLVSIGLIVGCAKKQIIGRQTMVYKSGPTPDWITVVPKTKKGMMFFRGMKTGAPRLEGGETDARAAASRKVAETSEGRKRKKGRLLATRNSRNFSLLVCWSYGFIVLWFDGLSHITIQPSN